MVNKITFDKNEIVFYQDHRWHKGIPEGVDFELSSGQGNSIWLTAKGYGDKDNYGNGKIAVDKRNIEHLL